MQKVVSKSNFHLGQRVWGATLRHLAAYSAPSKFDHTPGAIAGASLMLRHRYGERQRTGTETN
ncbi:hypothetical protein HanHA89_Chr01g0012071 [Helianthus annuus]|nr:hypothetical protein HanHA89_Chr01g0012071 [Helianthus annuus]